MDQQNPPTNPVPPAYVPPTPQQPQGQQQSPPPAAPAFERPREDGMHPMVVLQPGEMVVATIKRHPLGIVSLYAAAVIGMAVAAVVAFLMLPNLTDQFHGD